MIKDYFDELQTKLDEKENSDESVAIAKEYAELERLFKTLSLALPRGSDASRAIADELEQWELLAAEGFKNATTQAEEQDIEEGLDEAHERGLYGRGYR